MLILFSLVFQFHLLLDLGLSIVLDNPSVGYVDYAICEEEDPFFRISICFSYISIWSPIYIICFKSCSFFAFIVYNYGV
jgi:hypothetical protein